MLTLEPGAEWGSKTGDHYLNGAHTKAGSCFDILSKIIEKNGL